jgi:hypothetical protein
MSTLRTINVANQAGTKSAPAADIIDGYAKAWVRFHAIAGTPTILAAFNVTSITDNGVGQFTANFTQALADANYSAVGSGCRNSGTARSITLSGDNGGVNYIKSASSHRFLTFCDGATAAEDPYDFNYAAFR